MKFGWIVGLLFVFQLGWAQWKPDIRCIYVFANGNCRITWKSYNGNPSGFIRYELYQSNKKTGPYALVHTQTQISTTNYTDTGCNAQMQSYFYFIKGVTGNSITPQELHSDTLQSIYTTAVYATALPYLQLSFNRLSLNYWPGAIHTFSVEREFPKGIFKLIGKTPEPNFKDTLSICKDSLGYRIRIQDSLGCTSQSNRFQIEARDTKDPDEPKWDSITVMPNGHTLLTWSIPKDADISGYRIQYKNNNGINSPLQLIPGRFNQTFEWSNAKADSQSVALYVGAQDSCGRTSTISYNSKTVFLKTQLLACQQQLLLEWTPYTSPVIPDRVSYTLYQSVNESPWYAIAQTTLTQYRIDGFDTHQNAKFFIRAFTSAKNSSSSSNISTFTAVTLPDFSLHFNRIEPLENDGVCIAFSHPLHPSIRWVELSYSKNLTTWQTLYQVATPNHSYQVVNSSHLKPDPSLWFRLRLLDSCYQSFGNEAFKKWNWLNARISQFAPLYIDLNWSNHSSDTLLQVQSQIFRKNPQDAAWNLIESGSIQRYLDQPDSLSLLAGELHYKVLNLSANPQVSDSIWSQAIQVEPEGFFFIPNAFCPEGLNAVWRPIPYFIPARDYSLQIFNRAGTCVFETQLVNEGWNGYLASAGQYLYRISYKNSKQKAFVRSGTLTLLR